MTTEERLLKLENAVATLSDLAAKADARSGDMDKHFRMLTELTVSASERMDTQMDWINTLGAGQAELEVKVAALTDAQIRTEEALASLAQAQKRTEEALTSLTGRVDQLTTRVDKLADTVERYIEGRNGTA